MTHVSAPPLVSPVLRGPSEALLLLMLGLMQSDVCRPACCKRMHNHASLGRLLDEEQQQQEQQEDVMQW